MQKVEQEQKQEDDIYIIDYEKVERFGIGVYYMVAFVFPIFVLIVCVVEFNT